MRQSVDFRSLLRAAVRFFRQYGYQSADSAQKWLADLRAAALAGMIPDAEVREQIKRHMGAIFARQVDRGKVLRAVPAASRYTLEMVKPQLRAELDRRVLASVELIKLRRAEAVNKTLARFQGWLSSVPPGGHVEAEAQEALEDIGKPLAQVKYEQRRVAIDQGHKLASNIAAVVAHQSGAIAAIWHSQWRQAGYDYRPDHKERDGNVYLLRTSWARDQGLVKPGKAGFLDDITQPGQEVYCQCTAEYLTSLRDLPDDMLTDKGKAALSAPA